MYNGPPVSALVPRFPRGPSHAYAGSQNGYTPHSIHYDSHNQNSASSYAPNSGGQIESSTGSYTRDGINLKNRRTSFGLPIISTNPNFLVPTPQHESSVEMNDTNSEGSSGVIPIPPSNGNYDSSNNDVLLGTSPSETEYSMQESRCVNLLSKKFEPSKNKTWESSGYPQVDVVDSVPKKAPTVQDASLLLGLSSDTSSNNSPATVPTLQDETDTKTVQDENLPKTCFPVPIPEVYPKRLSLPTDATKLNALHCFIRADILEIFVVEPSPEAMKFRHAPSSSVGRVGFRCIHCAMARTNAMNAARDDEAPMSVFYPKTVSEIYRLVTSWQRCHLRKCKNLPKDVRDKWHSLRETEKNRGKTAYWAESAKRIGLVDCTSRTGGIRFDIKVKKSANAPVKEEFDSENTILVATAASMDENSEPKAEVTDKEKNAIASPRTGHISTPLGSSQGRNMMPF